MHGLGNIPSLAEKTTNALTGIGDYDQIKRVAGRFLISTENTAW